MVIGKTSPVTYQVLGHLKTCLVLAFGYTLLHDPFTIRNIIGILVAIIGMGLYSYFCVQDNKKKQSADLSLASQVGTLCMCVTNLDHALDILELK
jgi:solute carrier family 35 protein E3